MFEEKFVEHGAEHLMVTDSQAENIKAFMEERLRAYRDMVVAKAKALNNQNTSSPCGHRAPEQMKDEYDCFDIHTGYTEAVKDFLASLTNEK